MNRIKIIANDYSPLISVEDWHGFEIDSKYIPDAFLTMMTEVGLVVDSTTLDGLQKYITKHQQATVQFQNIWSSWHIALNVPATAIVNGSRVDRYLFPTPVDKISRGYRVLRGSAAEKAIYDTNHPYQLEADDSLTVYPGSDFEMETLLSLSCDIKSDNHNLTFESMKARFPPEIEAMIDQYTEFGTKLGRLNTSNGVYFYGSIDP